jgi:uridine kinase
MDKIINEIINLIKKENKRIIIGISGHGASGKTTFVNNLLKLIGETNVNYINTDPYIIGSNIRKYTIINYEYKNKIHQDKMTACHPVAHNISILERDIHMLRDGRFLYLGYTFFKKFFSFFTI